MLFNSCIFISLFYDEKQSLDARPSHTIKLVGHMAIIVGAPALVWNEYSTELNGLYCDIERGSRADCS